MKKYYISSDIEGTNGICDWSETLLGDPSHQQFANRMTQEIAAVCNGINNVDKNCEILVKDAHDSGRNIDHEMLPTNVYLNRSWSKDPHIMMNEIDNTFTGSIFTGYHSAATKNGSPLAHTMNATEIIYMKINGEIASEFLYNYYISHYYNVPVIMVTGDEGLCQEVNKINPNITTVAAYKGNAGSVTSKHPSLTKQELQQAAQQAISKIENCKITMPENFEIEICVKEAKKALRASYYPGVKLINETTFSYTSKDYFDIMRMFLFV